VAVDTYIHKIFKDPGSIQDLQISCVAYISSATIHKDWIILFTCDAKNSFGGYVGNKEYMVLWNNGIDWDGMNDPARAFARGLWEGANPNTEQAIANF
jgi:hypothetical protein